MTHLRAGKLFRKEDSRQREREGKGERKKKKQQHSVTPRVFSITYVLMFEKA